MEYPPNSCYWSSKRTISFLFEQPPLCYCSNFASHQPIPPSTVCCTYHKPNLIAWLSNYVATYFCLRVTTILYRFPKSHSSISALLHVRSWEDLKLKLPSSTGSVFYSYITIYQFKSTISIICVIVSINISIWLIFSLAFKKYVFILAYFQKTKTTKKPHLNKKFFLKAVIANR